MLSINNSWIFVFIYVHKFFYIYRTYFILKASIFLFYMDEIACTCNLWSELRSVFTNMTLLRMKKIRIDLRTHNTLYIFITITHLSILHKIKFNLPYIFINKNVSTHTQHISTSTIDFPTFPTKTLPETPIFIFSSYLSIT